MLILLMFHCVNAQNVGIGTKIPDGRLQINHNSNELSGLLLVDSNTVYGGMISFKNLAHSRKIHLRGYNPNGFELNQNLEILTDSIIIATFRGNGNVGIGSPTPVARLTVGGYETAPNGLAAAIQLQNGASWNTWTMRAGAVGTSTPSDGFSIGDNIDYHFNISSAGNIGLGTVNPTAKLHVNGGVKIAGANTVELGAGVAGKELNAGKIGYNSFGSGGLEIVGAGTNTSNRSVFFFADGGTVFSGPVDVYGAVRINGNPGVQGQVLTSTGSDEPVWADAPYKNTTRFQVAFGSNTTGSGNMDVSSTGYNLNPADITVGANSITINRAGLYRIQGTYSGQVTYGTTTPPAWEPEVGVSIAFSGTMAGSHTIVSNVHFTRTNTIPNATYYAFGRYSIDLHLIAGAVLRFSKSLVTNGSPVYTFTGTNIHGYLISE